MAVKKNISYEQKLSLYFYIKSQIYSVYLKIEETPKTLKWAFWNQIQISGASCCQSIPCSLLLPLRLAYIFISIPRHLRNIPARATELLACVVSFLPYRGNWHFRRAVVLLEQIICCTDTNVVVLPCISLILLVCRIWEIIK